MGPVVAGCDCPNRARERDRLVFAFTYTMAVSKRTARALTISSNDPKGQAMYKTFANQVSRSLLCWLVPSGEELISDTPGACSTRPPTKTVSAHPLACSLMGSQADADIDWRGAGVICLGLAENVSRVTPERDESTSARRDG